MKLRTTIALAALLLALPLPEPLSALWPPAALGQAHAGPEDAPESPREDAGSPAVPRLVPLKGAGPGVDVWRDSMTGDVLIRGNLQGRARQERKEERPDGGSRASKKCFSAPD